MVSPRRRQLALPLETLKRQQPRFPQDAADRICEAMADLLLQVSDADLEGGDQTEEADDESAR